MDKKYLIAGGVGVVAIGGFLFIRSRKRAAETEATDNTSTSVADTSYYGGMAPISGGYSSPVGVSTGASTPSDESNSGSTNTGGGFDLTAIFGGLASVLKGNAASSVIANQHTSDSAILSTVLKDNSSVKVEHTDSGTIISKNDSKSAIDQIITNEYQTVLGRAPDEAGFAFWKNNLLNNKNFSIAQLHADFVNSDEAKKKAAATSTTPPKAT